MYKKKTLDKEFLTMLFVFSDCCVYCVIEVQKGGP